MYKIDEVEVGRQGAGFQERLRTLVCILLKEKKRKEERNTNYHSFHP